MRPPPGALLVLTAALLSALPAAAVAWSLVTGFNPALILRSLLPATCTLLVRLYLHMPAAICCPKQHTWQSLSA